MIRFEDVSIRYDPAGPVVLSNVDLHIPEGELCLVVGETGTGKSTLLQAINGLVPHFTGGVLSGRVTVAGRDTRDNPPRELADIVGMVLQDPMSGFVADVVEDELAYGMESLGVAPAVMRKQVEKTLNLMGLASPSWQGIYRWVRSVWPQRRMAPLRRAHKSASNWSWAKLATLKEGARRVG